MTDSGTVDTGQFFSVRIDPDTRRLLEELAKRNERTLSAEIRVALRQHLALDKPREDE